MHIILEILCQVSRVHFSLHAENGLIILTNNSLNGTFINGFVADKKPIFPGDIVSILQEDFQLFKLEFWNTILNTDF